MIPSLTELSITTFLKNFSPTESSKEDLRKKIPSDIHHLICQTILEKVFCQEEGYHLKHLAYFSDPCMLETRPIHELLYRGPYCILPGRSDLTDSQVVNLVLSTFPNLKKLDLSKTRVFLYDLNASNNLVELSVYENTSNKSPLTLKDKWPHLKKVNFSETPLTSLKGLFGLPLEELDLASCTQIIFDKQWGVRSAWPSLKKIDLRKTPILDLKTLNDFPLEELHLAYYPTDVDLALRKFDICEAIKDACPHLKRLYLSERRIESLKGLEGLFHLKKLTLEKIRIRLKGWTSLSLEELTLRQCWVFSTDTDNFSSLPAEEFEDIKDQFPHLKKLIIWEAEITSLKGLEGLPLKELLLYRCDNLSIEELLTIQDKLPNLKILQLSPKALTEEQVSILRQACPLLDIHIWK